MACDGRVQRAPIRPSLAARRLDSGGRRRRPSEPMSAQGLAFTVPFVVTNSAQFQPPPPRGLSSATYTDDFNAVKALGRSTGSTRTADQTALAPFWEGNASVHWNQAANQIARANDLSMSASNRLLAVLNLAMADTAITTWSRQALLRRRPRRGHLASGHRDSAGRQRRQPGHRSRSRVAAAYQHPVASRVSSRASRASTVRPRRCSSITSTISRSLR